MRNFINKKNTFLCLSFFLFVSYAQSQQANDRRFFLKLEGSYGNELSGNLLSQVNAYQSETKGGDVCLSVGHFYQNWVMGAGFEYASAKTTALGSVFTLDMISQELTEVSVKRPSGKVFFGYGFPLQKGLYLTPTFYCGYGKSWYDNKSIHVSVKTMEESGSGIVNSVARSRYSDSVGSSSFDYLGLQLAPELSYFFSRHFGCNLQLGGAFLEVNDNSWSNKQTVCSFAPKYWRVGVLVAL